MLFIEVVNETDVLVDEDAVAAAAMFVLDREGLKEGEVAVAFVESRAIAELNETYRGVEGPTDVLSFPDVGEDDDDWFGTDVSVVDDDSSRFLGDVVVCPAVARENASEDGISPDEELRRLLVHGILHLLGHDHETDQGEMRAREEVILADLWWKTRTFLRPE